MSLDDAIDHCGFGWFQIKLLFVAGACWMSESMEMMLLSVLSPILTCRWKLSGFMEASITTVVFLGMMVGSVMWGTISDRWGRRFGFLATTVFTFVFGFLSAFSPDIYVMLLLRCLVGVGVGGGHTAFTLFAEYLPRKNRALCLILIELFWTVGTIGEAGLAWVLLPKMDPRYGWRVLLGLSSLPLLILLLCYSIVPESARFLLAKGREPEAVKLVEEIAKSNKTPIPCKHLVFTTSPQKAKFSDLMVPALRKTSILLWIIWCANAFVYYGMVLMSTEIFQQQSSGARCNGSSWFAPVKPHHNTHDQFTQCHELQPKDYEQLFITSAAELPGIIFTVFVIDKLGRKKTQALEFFVTATFISLVCLCLGFGTVVVLFVVRGLITGAFQASYVYTPEVYPTSVRSTALGVCSTMARIGGILTPYVAQVLIGVSDYLSLGLYFFVALCAGVASILLPIETAGRDMPDTVAEVSKMEENDGERIRLLDPNVSQTFIKNN